MTDSDKKAVGRAKNPPLEKIGPEFVDKTPQDMIDAEGRANQLILQREHNLVIIDKKFGDGQPYSLERAIAQADFYINACAASYLEAGRILAQIKEHEEHGNFLNALQRLDMSPRTAQRMIQVALKFSGASPLARLSSTKLLELVTEDDDDLEALATGGTLAGLKLDDIDRMGSRELKAALRKSRDDAKAQAEVHEKLLESKNQKLDVMERQFLERTKRVSSWDGVVSELTLNIMTMTGGALEKISHLGVQIDEILREAVDRSLSDAEVSAIVEPLYDNITNLEEHIAGLRARFDNELSGYLPVHEVRYAPLPEPPQWPPFEPE